MLVEGAKGVQNRDESLLGFTDDVDPDVSL